MSPAWGCGAGASWTGTKSGLWQSGTIGLVTFANWLLLRLADSTTQRRSMLAFKPLASAMAAVETPKVDPIVKTIFQSI